MKCGLSRFTIVVVYCHSIKIITLRGSDNVVFSPVWHE